MSRQLCDMCNGHGTLDGVDDDYGRVFTCPDCLGAMWVDWEPPVDDAPRFTVRSTIPVPDEAPTEPSITYLDEDDVLTATGTGS